MGFKDPFGHKIKVGDKIAHVRRYGSGRYLDIVKGTVEGFTKTAVRYSDKDFLLHLGQPHLIFVDVSARD